MARLIPVEDYGIAATFAVVMAMVEMASTFGLQQQIVQSKDGDDLRFQAALQGFQVVRGIFAGLALFLIAGPIARFLDIPEVIWAYQLLALVPILKAFEHFDIHRLNRQMRFWPLILTSNVPALLSLLAVWPLAISVGDWRIMLYAIITHISLTTLTSHLVAERPYRLVFDTAIIASSLRFGWPILVNSILLFFVFQGDKLIVGRAFGMEALAVFAMGITLTLTPTMVIAKSAQNLFLPQLSAGVKTPVFLIATDRTLQVVTGATLIFTLVIFLFGGAIIHTLLGEKYASLIPLLVWFSIGQALRVVKAGPAIVALSLGHTSNAMMSNMTRVLILPLIWAAAEQTESLFHILSLIIFGELGGAALAFYLLSRKSNLNLQSVLAPQIPSALIMVLVALSSKLYPPTEALPSYTMVAFAALGIIIAFLMAWIIRRITGGVRFNAERHS